jgi:hypothetical protein
VDLSSGTNRNWLEFTDYDTGEILDFSPIPAYSPKRVRVNFRPKETGEFNYNLQIENENDSSNTIETRVHALVRAVLREETLLVNTGNLLDFSDCCAGMWKKKEIILRNVSDSPLEVTFSCDDPQVIFSLRTEESADVKHNRKSHDHSCAAPDLERPHPERLQDISSLISKTPSNSELSMSRNSLSSRGSSRGSSPAPPSESHIFDIGPVSIVEQFERTSRAELSASPGLSDEIARIDEILMRPGKERHIEVCYKPLKDLITPDYRAGKLVKRNFRITIAYCQPRSKHSVEKKTVQCVARTCTSFIEISPPVLNFGDTDGMVA